LPEPSQPSRIQAFLERGFRPFFLLAGAYGVIVTGAWIAAYAGLWFIPTLWPVLWWHGHEMIFGFAAAAISGFLLTAVPEWTGTPPRRGLPLALLAVLWIIGRVAFWCSRSLPPVWLAAADLVYVPALMALVALPILRAPPRWNTPIPFLLLLLFVANLSIHLQMMGVPGADARIGLLLGVYTLVLLIAIITGRLIPLFTRNALRRQGVEAEVSSSPLLDRLAMTAVVVAFALDLLPAGDAASGIVALATAGVLLLRAKGWQTLRILRQPILWVLHAGYAWICLGFACKGLADLTGAFPGTSAFHAFTAGAIGTTVLAIMSRVTLGHTGRPLRAPPIIVLAYACVSVGAILRALAPALTSLPYTALVLIGGLFWAGAYALFCIWCWPVVTRPRVAAGAG
jgi:uncharacterized protein involved in response to NO